jgi:protein-disulfide isomerase
MDTAHDARRQGARPARTDEGYVENAEDESYNRPVSNPRISRPSLLVFLLVSVLGAAGCERKQNAEPVKAPVAAGPVDTTPLPGFDTSKLDATKQKLFYKLLGSLQSPCGKTESLRKSMTDDKSCRRAPFAVRYVLTLVEDEVPEPQIDEEYKEKYASKEAFKIDVSKAPRIGNDDALVRIVEFYDYACSACRQFKPILDQIAEENRDKAAVFFMMYPLGNWVDSPSAAQAAIAAAQQGKFNEMHRILFDRTPQHNREAVMGYAKELGLDVEKFTAAYEAAASQVASDHAQGEKAGVKTTPTLFINDRRYTNKTSWKYVSLWIEEEVAVNR